MSNFLVFSDILLLPNPCVGNIFTYINIYHNIPNNPTKYCMYKEYWKNIVALEAQNFGDVRAVETTEK